MATKRKRTGKVLHVLLAGILVLVLAAIFAPHHCGSPRRAKEATLRVNVQILRYSIATFHQDTGVYPATLADLIAPNEQLLIVKVKKGSYQGPYLTDEAGVISGTALPKNPFVKQGDNAINHHWRYDAKTGVVQSAVNGKTKEGESYSSF